MDDAIELDYEPTLDVDDSATLAKHDSAEAPNQTLPPASVVESTIEGEPPSVSRHVRIRYRSSSSENINRSHSPSPYYPSPLRITHGSDRRFGGERRSVEANKRRIQRAKLFGIEPPPDEYTITRDELLDLYDSMGVDPDDDNIRLRSVFVRGIDDLTEFQIEKIFAEFCPTTVEMIDGVSCNVIWHDEYVVGKMLLEMTKPLKRVRGGRLIEEGELAESSDEEEGEMKEEQGDDVTIHMSKASSQQSAAAKATDNFVEVDVDQVDIPPGKWRVITKHVGHNRLIILRFSCREDIRKGRVGLIQRRQQSLSKETVDRDGFSYKWTNRKNRVRPGLNIFNKDGDELEWDYEHDTRFYVDLDAPDKNPSPATDSFLKRPSRVSPLAKFDKEPEETILGKRVVKSRGRGSKRFKSLDDILKGRGSMAADDEEKSQAEQKRRAARDWQDRESDEGDDSDLSPDRDPSPTPQPWDARRTSVRLRITRPGHSKLRKNANSRGMD